MKRTATHLPNVFQIALFLRRIAHPHSLKKFRQVVQINADRPAPARPTEPGVGQRPRFAPTVDQRFGDGRERSGLLHRERHHSPSLLIDSAHGHGAVCNSINQTTNSLTLIPACVIWVRPPISTVWTMRWLRSVSVACSKQTNIRIILFPNCRCLLIPTQG